MKKRKKKYNFVRLFVAILACEAVGILGSIATVSSVDSWYTTLNKPLFNPPPWLFGPVWTLLYFLMGIALYWMWERKKISSWFWIQLSLNFTWSFVFFGFKMPGLAFLNIVLLWIAIIRTIKDFYAEYKPAGLILLPYLFWVTFASLLNLAIWILN